MSAKKILILDDHALFADGLALILGSLEGECDVSVANDAQMALSDTLALKAYDLVLIDLHMPSFDGFAFLTALKLQKLPVRVAVISGTENKAEIERALSLGASGFIPKDSPSPELLRAVNGLLSGQDYLPEAWVGEIDWLYHQDGEHAQLGGQSDDELTQRQLQVLKLVSQGLQNKQISTVMGISVSAVKGHIENIFKALRVNNRTACVQAARDAGFIE